MKSSEALLRSIAAVGGEIPAVQLDEWLSKLVETGFIKQEVRDDQNVFYYKLTEKANLFLKLKGVEVK